MLRALCLCVLACAAGAAFAEPPARLKEQAAAIQAPLTQAEREYLHAVADPKPGRSGVWQALSESSEAARSLELRAVQLRGYEISVPSSTPALAVDPAFAAYYALYQRGLKYMHDESKRTVAAVESRLKKIPQLDRNWQTERARASLEAILKKRSTQEKPISFAQADQIAKDRTRQVFGEVASPERTAFYRRALSRAELETQIRPQVKDVWKTVLTPAERAEFIEALQRQIADSWAALYKRALLDSGGMDGAWLTHLLAGERPLTPELLKQSEIQAVKVPDPPGRSKYRLALRLPNGENALLAYRPVAPNGERVRVLPGDGDRFYARKLSSAGSAVQRTSQDYLLETASMLLSLQELSSYWSGSALGLVNYGFSNQVLSKANLPHLAADLQSDSFGPYTKGEIDRTSIEVFWGGIAQDPEYWERRERLTREKKLPLAQTSTAMRGAVSSGGTRPALTRAPSRRLELSDSVGNFADAQLDRTPLFKVSRSVHPMFYHLTGVHTQDPALHSQRLARSQPWSKPSLPVPLGVTVESLAALEPSTGGRLAIPTPTKQELQSLRLVDARSQRELRLGSDYEVLFDPDEGGYWVQFMAGKSPAQVTFEARLQSPVLGGSTRTRAPALERIEVLILAQELRAAQLPKSAQALEALAAQADAVPVSHVARSLSDSAFYTYVPERDLPLESATGPFKDASRYIDADGDLAVQCSGGNSIYCQLMGRARERSPKLWRTQMNKGFQVAAGQSTVLAKDAHAISVHIGPQGAREYSDATPAAKKGQSPASLEEIPLEVRQRMEARAERELQARAQAALDEIKQSYTLQRDAWRTRLEERRVALRKTLLDNAQHFAELQNPGRWDPSLPHAKIPRLLAAAAAIEDGTLLPSDAIRVLSDLIPELREKLSALGPEPSKKVIFDAVDQWSRDVALPQLERAAASRLKTRGAPLRFPSYSDAQVRERMQEALRVFAGAPNDCAPGTLGGILQGLKEFKNLKE